jgi:hypothetical protein
MKERSLEQLLKGITADLANAVMPEVVGES